MAETLNKRLQRKLEREAHDNAARYWAKKLALSDGALPRQEKAPAGSSVGPQTTPHHQEDKT